MKAIIAGAVSALLTLGSFTTARSAAWTEGVNYFLIAPARPTALPAGKVEVTEVFSYACPACNLFLPTMHKLKQSLPANAVVDYVPAAFNTSEDWPMFQLAYCTAQALGIDQQTHDAMFDAVWKSGELAVVDTASRQLKSRMPGIEDAAKFYSQHAAVTSEKFLAAAKSMPVDMKVRASEALIQSWRIDRTPTIVVNGKYKLYVESAGGNEQLIDLVKFLVTQESK